MRLSAIIARAKELTGEDDPMTDAERVERAGCVFDGVRITSEQVEELEDEVKMLSQDLSDEEDRGLSLRHRLRGALTHCRELRRHVDADGLKILGELENALED